MTKKKEPHIVIKILDWTLMITIIVLLTWLLYKNHFGCTEIIYNCTQVEQLKIAMGQHYINITPSMI